MGYLISFITVAIWAGSYIVSKMAVGVIEPATLAFYRCLFAFLVLTPVCLPKIKQNIDVIKKNYRTLVYLGFWGMGLSQSMTYFSGHYTSSINMSLVNSLIPAVTLAMSIIILKTRLSIVQYIGVLVSLSGVVYVLVKGDINVLKNLEFNYGDILMLVGTFSYSLYGIILNRNPSIMSGWTLLYCQLFVASVLLCPLMLVTSESYIPSTTSIPLIIYAVFFLSIISPYFWKVAIDKIGAMKSSLSMNFMPVIAAILSYIILGEDIETYHVIGTVIIVSGLVAINLTRQKRSSRSTPAESNLS
ncbi:DMT family transporter [Vibrio hippocampi]|uniref:EamA domain-containing protein n=1 Tax=Vibrio hippocampi TaxID=654686 RepID=A0ABN8DLV1_9VIBR|nr:DMT family transporter [Vibrio hippocampi]CAH0529299.1 hypothetical protein VHP8226_03150 [Vibrio hippocampi]